MFKVTEARLRFRNGCGRFQADLYDQGHTVGNATLNPAGIIRSRCHRAIFIEMEGVIFLSAGAFTRIKATAEGNAFNAGNTKNGAR